MLLLPLLQLVLVKYALGQRAVYAVAGGAVLLLAINPEFWRSVRGYIELKDV